MLQTLSLHTDAVHNVDILHIKNCTKKWDLICRLFPFKFCYFIQIFEGENVHDTRAHVLVRIMKTTVSREEMLIKMQAAQICEETAIICCQHSIMQ